MFISFLVILSCRVPFPHCKRWGRRKDPDLDRREEEEEEEEEEQQEEEGVRRGSLSFRVTKTNGAERGSVYSRWNHRTTAPPQRNRLLKHRMFLPGCVSAAGS